MRAPRPASRPLLALLLLLVLAPAATALAHPMAGVLRQGERAGHEYDGSHGGLLLCPMVDTVAYTVTLTYAPASDTLTLRVPGRGSATGSGGHAQLSFIGGPCARFDVEVLGTSVADLAAYEVRVTEAGGA